MSKATRVDGKLRCVGNLLPNKTSSRARCRLFNYFRWNTSYPPQSLLPVPSIQLINSHSRYISTFSDITVLHFIFFALLTCRALPLSPASTGPREATPEKHLEGQKAITLFFMDISHHRTNFYAPPFTPKQQTAQHIKL